MSRSLYILGAPGTGKSTVMAELVAQLGLTFAPDERVYREIWVNPLLDQDSTPRGFAWGKQRGTFSGTDALSMSVMPRAIEWMNSFTLPEYVLGEGMRLSSPKFLVELDRLSPLTLVYLMASPEVLEERIAERGHDFEPVFLKAARTRATNAAGVMESLGYQLHTFDTGLVPSAEIAKTLLDAFS